MIRQVRNRQSNIRPIVGTNFTGPSPYTSASSNIAFQHPFSMVVDKRNRQDTTDKATASFFTYLSQSSAHSLMLRAMATCVLRLKRTHIKFINCIPERIVLSTIREANQSTQRLHCHGLEIQQARTRLHSDIFSNTSNQDTKLICLIHQRIACIPCHQEDTLRLGQYNIT